MKHQSIIWLGLFVLTYMVSCKQNQNNQNKTQNITETGESPVIYFEKNVHDFGKIITGERVSYGFRFSNTGGSPLLITGIRSGCGCTVGDYPTDPIMPGYDGKIDVIFNSSGRRGFQSESVRVLSNAEETVVTLRITAEVLER